MSKYVIIKVKNNTNYNNNIIYIYNNKNTLDI